MDYDTGKFLERLEHKLDCIYALLSKDLVNTNPPKGLKIKNSPDEHKRITQEQDEDDEDEG